MKGSVLFAFGMFLVFVFAIVLVLAGCNDLASDKIREFIPGMYVRKIHNEFTEGRDTLIIKVQDESAGIYFIDKMVGHQKHLDGKTFPPEHIVEQWTAVYDKNLHQLIVQNKERVFSFDPAKNQLILNRTVYDKVTQN